jgi:hypothetical protein
VQPIVVQAILFRLLAPRGRNALPEGDRWPQRDRRLNQGGKSLTKAGAQGAQGADIQLGVWFALDGQESVNKFQSADRKAVNVQLLGKRNYCFVGNPCLNSIRVAWKGKVSRFST